MRDFAHCSKPYVCSEKGGGGGGGVNNIKVVLAGTARNFKETPNTKFDFPIVKSRQLYANFGIKS